MRQVLGFRVSGFFMALRHDMLDKRSVFRFRGMLRRYNRVGTRSFNYGRVPILVQQ